MASSIQEGFLCPICMTDLGDVFQLEIHFHEKHSKEDPAFVQNLKGLFGKAKRKLDEKLGKEDILTSVVERKETEMLKTMYKKDDQKFNPVSGIHFDLIYPISSSYTPRASRSLFEVFQNLRSKVADRRSAETNKLIVRLEKLLKNLPIDPVKRRAHEQGIVPWIPEDTVARCPDCAKSFNLARRKHHCRLCGSILCNECSSFLDCALARRLINPATISHYTSLGDTSNIKTTEENSPTAKIRIKNLARNRSRESLMSLLDSKVNEPIFRTCIHCSDILKKRDNQVEQDSGDPPIFIQFYQRLRVFMAEGEDLSKKYIRMAESLNAGESEYRLEEAKILRLQIMKMAENIDFISKKILNHSEETNAIDGTAQTLQQRIRQTAVNFIKETLVGFSDVPSESELEILKKQRVEESARRVEDEKNSARIAKIKYANKYSKSPTYDKKPETKTMNYEAGFVLSPNASFGSKDGCDDDPMVQQIAIIEGFISQAKEARKMDEVKMLEENLMELKLEHRKNLLERQELEDNYNSYKHVFKAVSTSDHPTEFDEYDQSGKNPFF